MTDRLAELARATVARCWHTPGVSFPKAWACAPCIEAALREAVRGALTVTDDEAVALGYWGSRAVRITFLEALRKRAGVE